jgi:hypothetical protein
LPRQPVSFLPTLPRLAGHHIAYRSS